MSSAIPVSLGKPSLRRRLEAYYSLIAPDQVMNQQEWLGKFDKIAAKYGGSNEGERKLAKKLEAKYGSTVRLLLAESAEKNVTVQEATSNDQREETWYQLTEKETNSGIVDFSSTRFDPVAALQAPEDAVIQSNPFLRDCPRMDRIDQCRSRLPVNDPLYRTAIVRKAATETPSVKKKSSLFGPLHENLESKGPFAVLHKALAERKRLRVVIRYVNGIRGTLTGHLVAFDKHMNLILRDVLEVYSLRLTERKYETTNLEQEIARREQPVRQRHLRNIMVRGDNVVLAYFAESERSAFPKTSKAPKGSIYRKATVEKQQQQMGTLGSLLFAQQRRTQGKSKFSTTSR
jgi:small nuclear ribonucleoprotein (snRNP)-like protein